ncbi:MAG TPA: SatD family protein [Anaerolineaceae bacterium]|nr:SatD family protein [Anaerolineaceae bacterium]
MQIYLAVIGDIIDSKKIKNRGEIQFEMKKTFQDLNQEYSDLIVSKFTLTIGDEFQALLKPARGVWQLLDLLTVQSSAPFRLGLGYGEIRTQIDPEQSLAADGEAFWRARNAIKIVHVQNWNGRCHVLFEGCHTKRDAILNSLILAAETIKTQWTHSQAELFRTLMKEGIYQVDFNQKSIAEKLGLSESALSKRLTNSNIKVYFQLRETLGQFLEDYGKCVK